MSDLLKTISYSDERAKEIVERVAQSLCSSNSAALHLINIHFLLTHRDDVHGLTENAAESQGQRLCATYGLDE